MPCLSRVALKIDKITHTDIYDNDSLCTARNLNFVEGFYLEILFF